MQLAHFLHLNDDANYTKFFKEVKQLLTGSFDCLVAMILFIVLKVNIFLLRDKYNRNLLNPIGVGDSIVFFEMYALVYILKNRRHISWINKALLLSLIGEQIGRNFPYEFWWIFP